MASDAAAHRLFAQGRYAEAAELFTDPRWKGVALYRSDQWWRAAEAFVRASDPDSLYNLGNCYVRLGYYALALEAYNAAFARKPGFEDAAFNAALMRRILAEDDGNDGGTAARPQTEAVDEIASERQQDGGSQPPEPGPDGQPEDEPQGGGEQSGAGEQQADRDPGGADAGQGDASDGRQEEKPAGGGTVEGREDASAPSADASGGSAGADAGATSLSAGARATLEDEQAAEQWLNRIGDDPGKYLRSRIALEHRRRKAAGALPVGGGEAW